MSILNQISRLVKDPPPNYVFELSEAGIAFAQPATGSPGPGFCPSNPARWWFLRSKITFIRADAATAVAQAHRAPRPRPQTPPRRPDSAGLRRSRQRSGFRFLPGVSRRAASLIRFRLKKTLPFDIDSAAVSYFAQPAEKGAPIEVVAVIVALEIIARYEALFRAMNFHAGEVTTSALAALHLCPPRRASDAVNVIAKLSGNTLTVMVLRGETLKLFRCVALEEVTEEQILAVLHPTFSYVEDELAAARRKTHAVRIPLRRAGRPAPPKRNTAQRLSARPERSTPACWAI